MTFLRRLRDNEPPDSDPDKTVTLPRLQGACITVTMVAPNLTVHNVMKGSYVHRVMLANGYKEQEKS
jgi:hypothetical protein